MRSEHFTLNEAQWRGTMKSTSGWGWRFGFAVSFGFHFMPISFRPVLFLYVNVVHVTFLLRSLMKPFPVLYRDAPSRWSLL